MTLTAEQLAGLSVAELEKLSYAQTAQRQALNEEMRLVQQALSHKIEAERIEKMLGRPAQTVTAVGIESAEQA